MTHGHHTRPSHTSVRDNVRDARLPAPLGGRLESLYLVSELPPVAVHVLRACGPGVNVPPELVHQVAERQEGDPLQGHVEEDVDVGFLVSHVHLLPH